VKQAVRRLGRAPAFALGFVLVLGLGLGAAVSILQVVDALWLRALPFPEADRLVRLYFVPPSGTPRVSPGTESFVALRRHGEGIFSGVAGHRLSDRTLDVDGEPLPIAAQGVTEGWGEVLGLVPANGRLFTADEEAAGEASGVVLVSDGFWRRHLGADPAAVGSTLRMDGRPVTVVGVLPRGYAFPYAADLWYPIRAEDPTSSPWAFHAPARLAPGVSVEAANAALAALAPELTKELPARARELRPLAVPLRETLLDGEDRVATAALAAVAILLALVTVNLGALLHARWTRGRRELAVRQALGASTARLASHLVAESALLGAAGVGVAFALARLVRPLLERQLPGRLAEVSPDVASSPRVVLVAVALAAALVAASAGVSAWHLARGASFTRLRGDSGAGGSRRERRAAALGVALQVALALALGTATLAMVGDLRARARVELGYDANRLELASLALSGDAWSDPERRVAFERRMLDRLSALPGAEATAATVLFPSPNGAHLSRPAAAAAYDPTAETPLAHYRLVTPGFGETIGMKLRRGRWLEPRDETGPPVALLSERLARRLFPDGDAIGGRVLDARNPEAPAVEVVGVVADLHEFTEVEGAWYLPLAPRMAEAGGELTFVVRHRPDSGPAGHAALRAALDDVDATVALGEISTPRVLVDAALAPRRDAAGAASFLATFGVLLAALGLFALVAEGVARRRRELGLRLALGATHGGLFRRLVGESLRLAAAGVALGVVGAVAALAFVARALEAPELASSSWPVVAAAAAALGAVLAASSLAARRALALEPSVVLRDE